MPFWSKKQGGGGSKRRIKILFVTDLHGSELTFRKFLNALEISSPDVFIGGGDVAGKALLPVLDSGNGHVRVHWQGEDRSMSREQLQEVYAHAGQLGFYPYEADAAELERLQGD